jgi:hypothetical protein
MGADWLVRVDFESVEDLFIPFLLWSFRLKKWFATLSDPTVHQAIKWDRSRLQD